MYTLTQFLGWYSMLSAVVVGGMYFYADQEHSFSTQGLLSVLAMQIAIGAYLVYASKQKSRGTEIGHKMYPSSIVACILFGAFAYRWFWYGS